MRIMTEAHEPLKPAAKKLPEIKNAMQRHHDYYLGLKPEEIKEGDEGQVALAKDREAKGEVKPVTPPQPQA